MSKFGIRIGLLMLCFAAVSCGNGSNASNTTPQVNIALKTNDCFLIGTENGLYYADASGDPVKIWAGAPVRKIIRTPYGVFLLTTKGVVFTADYKKFEYRNQGLNFKLIRHYDNTNVTFSREIQDLRDMECDPNNQNNLAVCNKEGVFYSTNRGLNWIKPLSPSWFRNIKAVAIYTDVNGIHLFGSQPFIGGVNYHLVGKSTDWAKIRDNMEWHSGEREEVADIMIRKTDKGVMVLASYNFSPTIFQMNPANKRWSTVYKPSKKFDMIESMSLTSNNVLQFVTTDGIHEFAIGSNTASIAFQPKEAAMSPLTNTIKALETKMKDNALCFASIKNGTEAVSLSELWMLTPEQPFKYVKAEGRKGIYVSSFSATDKNRVDSLLKMLKRLGLNMIVIDMKDDSGLLRFVPKSDYVLKMGRYANPADIDYLAKVMKSNDIYMVARLVVFKDNVLFNYNSNELAIQNKAEGGSWIAHRHYAGGGIKNHRERWVDPFSLKVWRYVAEVGKDLITRGFDEIQFDYIRFPTDGGGIDEMSFKNQDEGMDKESGLMSFLQYAREQIDAPISIDIYGFNGWARTSGTTGQDVEMLMHYIDVICPMYYPSHFPQSYMAYSPAEERPYRIYYYGCLRNYYIARKQLIIRPWVQAFKLNVSYDNAYYNVDYVRREIKGVKESIDQGFTFWNAGVAYGILSQAMSGEPSPGKPNLGTN